MYDVPSQWPLLAITRTRQPYVPDLYVAHTHKQHDYISKHKYDALMSGV